MIKMCEKSSSSGFPVTLTEHFREKEYLFYYFGKVTEKMSLDHFICAKITKNFIITPILIKFVTQKRKFEVKYPSIS